MAKQSKAGPTLGGKLDTYDAFTVAVQVALAGGGEVMVCGDS